MSSDNVPVRAPYYKRINRSDKLNYVYSMERQLGDDEETDYQHEVNISVALTASPLAEWQDIVAEVNKLRTQKDNDNPKLITVWTEDSNVKVYLTLNGFLKSALHRGAGNSIPYDELVELLAKDLVALRDFKAHSALGGKRKFSEFIPV